MPAAEVGKSSKIRHIVRLRQMLMRWRRKARLSACQTAPSDVPVGHVALCVGVGCRRFVVRATYLNHPVFNSLLTQAEEEYGFASRGPLMIPCDEALFEDVLRLVSGSGRPGRFEDPQKQQCHVDGKGDRGFWAESRPLLHGLVEKSVW